MPVNRRSPKGVPIYGKSVICRYAVVNVRCGAKLDAGGKAGRRRKAGCCGAAKRSCGCCELLVLRRSVGLALLVCIRSTSRADPVQAGPTARFCDLSTSKQIAATGRAIWGRKFRRANVCGGSRLKAGARSLSVSRGAGCFGGGAERAQLAEASFSVPSWRAMCSWRAGRGAALGGGRSWPGRRRGVGAKAEPSWVALPAGAELHRNAGAE